MKNILVIALLILCTGSFMACSGDHSDRGHAGDTANHQSVPVNVETANPVDTTKVTTVTGDAGNLDNSSSGGTKIAKDTSARKMKPAGDKK